MEFLLLSTFGEIASYVGYVLLAVLVLLAMITVHEFGHYVTGKLFGFGIEEFAIGFGPKIYSRLKRNGERFSVRIFPLGGFCAFKGEDKDDSDPTAFNNKAWWKRIIVLISGAFMNYVFALLLIVIMFGVYGQTSLMAYKTVPDTGIAIENRLQDKDVLLKANGNNVYLVSDLMQAVQGRNAGDKVVFTVLRSGETLELNLTLRTDTNFENLEDVDRLYTALGIYYETDLNGGMVNGGLYSTGVRYGFFKTLALSFEYSFRIAGTIFMTLGQLITGVLGIGSVGGTITTITITANAIKVGGIRYLLNIASFIGVNLAVFNLLPIPALDGSRTIFTLIEGIFKKPVPRRIEGIIHAIGMFALLLFAVFVDLQRCF
jgi:regulator of sigma E protease